MPFDLMSMKPSSIYMVRVLQVTNAFSAPTWTVGEWTGRGGWYLPGIGYEVSEDQVLEIGLEVKLPPDLRIPNPWSREWRDPDFPPE